MTSLVPREEIEGIVGVRRKATEHVVRLVTLTQTAYILHSQECLDSGVDLRACDFSRVLDQRGVGAWVWNDQACDTPVVVEIHGGDLVPVEILEDD